MMQIGTLPIGWKVKKLGEIADWASGGTPSKKIAEYWNGDIPWISASSMHTQALSKSKLMITREGLKSGSKLADVGSILLLVRGSMLWRKIPVGIATEAVAFNQDVKSLRVKEEVLPRYLLLWFSANENILLHRVVGTGIGAGKLDTDDIKNISVTYPSLSEQAFIVNLFSAWDEAIEKTEKLIEAKEKRFKWLLRSLISDQCSMNNKQTGWKKVRIGSFLTESRIRGTNGRDAQKITVKLYGKGVVPKDEKRSGSTTTRYYVRKPGQFIYSKLDFLNGAFGIISDKLDGFESTLDLPAFDISDSISKAWFLYFLIRPEYYTRQLGLAKGQRKARRVNPSEFLNSRIALPPIEIQQQIAETLSTAQKEIDLLKHLAEKYKTQKLGLMQKMLTGEWRLNRKSLSNIWSRNHGKR